LVPKCIDPAYTPKESIYSAQDVCDAFEYLDPSCGREEWRNIGMALKSGGYPFELWDAWSQKSPKYPGEKEITKQWNSFKDKPGGISIGTLFFEAEKAGWSPRPVARWDLHKPREKTENPMSQRHEGNTDGIDFPPGPVGVMARDILDAAMFKHKSFAIASALGVGASLAQGRYCTPNGEGCLGSYMFMVTDSGGGKADYTNPFAECVRAGHPLLLMGEVASGQALRKTLELCRARSLSLDEGIKWLMAMIDSKNENAQRLHGDFLSAWSGSTINEIITKDKTGNSPQIKNPRLTILGAGPRKSLVKLLQDGESLADEGLLSRIDFLVGEPAEPASFVKTHKYRPSETFAEVFKEIGGSGRESRMVDTKANALNSTFNFDDQVEVAWGEGTVELFNEFASFCYKRKVSSGLPSVWSRTAEKALRCGSVLAVFTDHKTPILTDYMLKWAIEWQRAIAFEIEGLCQENLGKSAEAMCRDKILFALDKEDGSCSRCKVGKWWRGWSKVDERTRQAAIDSLVRDGIILVSDSDSNRNKGEQRFVYKSRERC
jgi:hypothetical protein